MKRVVRRLLAACFRDRLERELDDEVRAHLELAERDARAAGLSPDEARLAALRRFGGIEQMKEEHRDARGAPPLEGLLRDVRHALRVMRRTPAVCAAIVVVLGIGIGANTTMFSAMEAMLLRPLNYGDPDRLVVVLHDGRSPVSFANFADWRAQNRSFEAMGAAEYWRPNLGLDDGAERVLAVRVTPDLLPLLGVPALHGQLFGAQDATAVDVHRVVISHGLWQRRFSGDAAVIGRDLRLDGEVYSVVAVMPRDFAFPPFWAVGAELWAPLPPAARPDDRGGNSLRVFARLKPDVSLAQAQHEIDAITARLDTLFPGTNRDVRVVPLKERVVGDTRLAVVVMMAAVAFVLLIACANAAHLLLARAGARRREVAVRVALGATRARILRQFLVESVLLALAGGVAGLVLAAGGVWGLTALAPAELPRIDEIRMNGAVLAFTIAASVLTGLLFGIVPGWQASRAALGDSLRMGRGITSDRSQGRLRDLLIASQIALALVLLAGAGLMTRSMMALRAIDPGFDPRGAIALEVSVHGTTHALPERRIAFFRSLVERIDALPGVQQVSAINHLPLDGDIWTRGFRIEGRALPPPGQGPVAAYRVVLPGYFETMGLRLVSGRDFSYRDTRSTPGAVILSENLARRYWPGEDPIGRRIALAGAEDGAPQWLTIVGLAADAVRESWDAPAGFEMYLPYLQTSAYLDGPESRYTYLTIVARTAGDASALLPAVRGAVAALDRRASVSKLTTMEAAVGRALARPRFELALLALFAGVAVFLAVAGVHSLMAYAVSRRTPEIALRLTLGAERADVRRMILRQAMIRIATGVAAGLGGALLLTRAMARLLYGVGAADPFTFIVATALLVAVALLASYAPAWRASRIDPIGALRQE